MLEEKKVFWNDNSYGLEVTHVAPTHKLVNKTSHAVPTHQQGDHEVPFYHVPGNACWLRLLHRLTCNRYTTDV